MRLFLQTTCAAILYATTCSIALPAQQYKVLDVLDNGTAVGTNPESTLTQGPDGNLYGVTTDNFDVGGGYGSIFKITPQGEISAVYVFSGTDGAHPISAPILGNDGNFYGVTAGTGNTPGTFYQLTPEGVLTTLYDLDYAYGQLALGLDGIFYGTMDTGSFGNGSIYKITPTGIFTSLHDFVGTDGRNPNAGLTLANDGNFYGVTERGGANGDGTIFRITPSGTFTSLYSFDGPHNFDPSSALTLGDYGELYGLTQNGGANSNGGIAFKISTAGVFTSLGSLTEAGSGLDPLAALVLSPTGEFYGATSVGGANDGGSIFSLSTKGVVTNLFSFNEEVTGGECYGMTQSTNGILYGTTETGGSATGSGVIFALAVGQTPFVAFQFAFGSVGQTVQILGQDFTGATAVNFTGGPATFQVISNTLIKATVPADAVTGRVTVTTQKGVLTSNRSFSIVD
jgi:uncharacterized repeat protein (TIGR03803 family)